MLQGVNYLREKKKTRFSKKDSERPGNFWNRTGIDLDFPQYIKRVIIPLLCKLPSCISEVSPAGEGVEGVGWGGSLPLNSRCLP